LGRFCCLDQNLREVASFEPRFAGDKIKIGLGEFFIEKRVILHQETYSRFKAIRVTSSCISLEKAWAVFTKAGMKSSADFL